MQHQGLPIGSPVSCLAAPLLLVPVWLDLRQRFGLPLLVYADDIIVFCKTQEECGRVFAWLNNRLHEDYALSLQIDKTRSGRFASTSLDYCGWNFKGGYSRVSEKKVEAFKQRVTRFVRQSKGIFQRAFFKRLNRKIDGFGSYYKHGDVAKQLADMDVFLRAQVRRWLSGSGESRYFSNGNLAGLGLRNMTYIYERSRKRSSLKKQPPILKHRLEAAQAKQVANKASGNSPELPLQEMMYTQLVQLTKIQKQQTKVLELIAERLHM